MDRAVLCSSLIDVEDYGNFVEQQNKWEIRAMLGEYFQVYFIRMLIITFNYVFYVNIVFK